MNTLTISRNEDRIDISFPASINNTYLQQLLDYLKVKSIAIESNVTDDQIVKLANKINKDWWIQNKGKFL
jgi:hypothetical protein